MDDTGGPPCPGIRIVSLTLDADHALIIDLADDLTCPHCGQHGRRWVIPVRQTQVFHEPRPADNGR